MRYFFIIMLAMVLISCKELEILRYEYHTTTQMGRTILAVTEDSVIVKFNGRTEPTYWSREVNAEEWEALNNSMKDVDMAKVPELEAPSDKRATDAAPFGRFHFIGKDTTIMSAAFDAKNPHEMLMPLMKEILKIEQNNKN